MNLSRRKLLYLILGAGGVLLSFPALLGLFAGLISILLGEFDSLDIVLVATGGLIGLYSSIRTWLELPLTLVRFKLYYSVGIALGCLSLLCTLFFVWSWPPAFLSGSGWDIFIGSYMYFLPIIVGLALLIEMWVSFK